MTESEKQELNGLLKERIEAGEILGADRQGRGFICPKCGNGTGRSGKGLKFKAGENLLKCFSCGEAFDPLGALQASEGLPDFSSTLERACQITGFRPSGTSPAPKSNGKGSQSPESVGSHREPPRATTEPQKAPEVDYSGYFEECFSRNDGSYLLSRGISEEVQIKHRIGYDPKWENPTSPKDSRIPRLIIPTSPTSYVARKAGPVSPNFDDRIRKAGSLHLLNEETLNDPEDLRPCFVVEGEIDALSLETIGERAVALGGTSGKDRLLELLRGATTPPVLILALDNDGPGRDAQDGKRDPQTGYLDPNDKGLYMELLSRGLSVFEADYSGERWTRKEDKERGIPKPLKDVNDFLIESRDAFEEWASQQVERTLSKFQEERESYLSESSDALDFFDRETEKISRPVPTGFQKLDRLLGGGLRVGLTTIGAGTSFGKTALTMQIAENMNRNGQDVLFFSLEMGANELRARSLSRLTAEILDAPHYSGAPASTFSDILNYRNLQNESQRSTIREARELYRSYCSRLRIIESQGSFSVEDVRRAVSRHRRLTGRVPVVFIDYLQVLHPLNPRESEKQQTDKNILELRRLAREFETPVVVLSSLNRAGYKKRPTLESFKESGGVEYGSDIVLMLSFEMKDDYFIETTDEETGKKKKVYDYDRAKRETPRSMLLSLLKNRNGNPTGVVPVWSYAKFSLFTERTSEESSGA